MRKTDTERETEMEEAWGEERETERKKAWGEREREVDSMGRERQRGRKHGERETEREKAWGERDRD